MTDEEFRNAAWAVGFEAGLRATLDVVTAAERLVADLEDTENAWQGVGVVAVEIRRLVDLRVALREAGYLREREPECTGIHAGHAGRWMCGLGFGPLCNEEAAGAVGQSAADSMPAPGGTYAPWMMDGRKPTIADYMEYAR